MLNKSANIAKVILCMLLVTGGIKSAAAAAGNSGAAAAAAVRMVKVYNALNRAKAKFTANVDTNTPLSQVDWRPEDQTEPRLRPFDYFKNTNMEEIDFDRNITDLQLDTGTNAIIEIYFMRATKAVEVLKTENPLLDRIDRMIDWWNRKAEGERQARLQTVQELIHANSNSLPDMEPMNKLHEVFAQAFHKTTALTREDFEDWLVYMENQQAKALEFLMYHRGCNQGLPVRSDYATQFGSTNPMFDLFTSVFKVLKGIHPIYQDLTVTRSGATEYKKKVNLNDPFYIIFPWARELRLCDVSDPANPRYEVIPEYQFYLSPNWFRSWFRSDFSPNTKLEIVEEIPDPKEYVLKKLKIAELQGEVLEKLREAKAGVAAELRVVQGLAEGASFHNFKVTGPKFNEILLTIMTCLIKLYDQLLEAKGNKELVQTKAGEWVDYMISENPVLLRLIADYHNTKALLGQGGSRTITAVICSIAHLYFKTTYLPVIDA